MIKTRKGISLIVLVITIIVMIILASSVVISLSNTNIINKAGDAVDEYNEQQNEILSMLEYADSYIDKLEGKNKVVIYSNKIQGSNGQIVMPVKLNDASKYYVLEVDSALYKGEVVLNMYASGNSYISVAALSNTGAYATELRHLIYGGAANVSLTADTDTIDSTESTNKLDVLFGTSGAVGVKYMGDLSGATITYDAAALGSELTITKISQIDRDYEGFAKLIMNLLKTGDISMTDAKDCIKYCINKGVLGYDYLNEMMEESSSTATVTTTVDVYEDTDVDVYSEDGTTDDGTTEETTKKIVFNEALEMQALKRALYNKNQELKDFEYSIKDQIMMQIYNLIVRLGVFIDDPYTAGNYFMESDILNEYFTRTVGNTIIPFTVEYSDLILKDLNEDGVLGGTYQCALYDMVLFMEEKGLAGALYRSYADLYATIYPLMIKYDGDPSAMPLTLQMELEEFAFLMESNSSSSSSESQASQLTVAMSTWFSAYSVYNSKTMNTMYTMIYNNGTRINTAGLKMGWNSLITPEIMGLLEMSRPYNLRTDSDAISRQGVASILNDLCTYIETANTKTEETTE